MPTELKVLLARLEQLEYDNSRIKTENMQVNARFHTTQRRLRIQAGLAFCALLAALFLSPSRRPALAQQTGGLPALELRVAALEKLVKTLQAGNSDLQAALTQETNRAKTAETALQNSLNAEAAARQSADSALSNRATALETKTQFVSIGTDGEMHIIGTNLHLENGMGATNGNLGEPYNFEQTHVNGMGNLIVGYNASRNNSPNVRTGSHNLILGDANNYSSYGGIVVGLRNEISSVYASVSGGFSNIASGFAASVSGGNENMAVGTYASVSGGAINLANGEQSASVSGGFFNVASGTRASVSGGWRNIANGYAASISGGQANMAGGENASVSGGYQRNATGFLNWAAGGLFQDH